MTNPVSAADRRALERQRRALAGVEHHDEGGAAWQRGAIDDADRHRARAGAPPLADWWATKTEPELHHRARTLGLLG